MRAGHPSKSIQRTVVDPVNNAVFGLEIRHGHKGQNLAARPAGNADGVAGLGHVEGQTEEGLKLGCAGRKVGRVEHGAVDDSWIDVSKN